MEQEDFNIREHQLTSRERDFENALRPLSFEDFSGQDKVVENLRIFVKAARLRGEALDHVLLHGPPGLGKTTLSNIIANELGVGFKVTSGPVLDKPGDLAETDITEDNVGEETIAEYEVVKDSEDENEYEKETASEDETIDADVINDLPEPEIVQAGNVRKSSSKVIGFIKK